MPLNPNLLERLVLFRLNKGPAPLLDLFGAASFECVALAMDLGFFEALEEGPHSAKALADAVDAHPEGTARLCDFLVAEGYLARSGRGDATTYRLTGTTERWLLPTSDTDMGPWLTFWDELVFPFWADQLETAVRAGEPTQTIYEWFDEEPERWETAQAGFRATASLLVDDVTDAVTVPGGAATVLDVGGGHGAYSVGLCRAYPDLAATIFDVPAAVAAIRDEVPADVADRVDVRAGDYRSDDLGEGFDLALVFNVVHAHDPAENVALFERVAEALAPGGRVAVLDQWEGTARTPVSKAGLQFVALTYLTTLGADVYPPEAVESWLREAGFVDVRRESVGPLSGMALVEARLP